MVVSCFAPELCVTLKAALPRGCCVCFVLCCLTAFGVITLVISEDTKPIVQASKRVSRQEGTWLPSWHVVLDFQTPCSPMTGALGFDMCVLKGRSVSVEAPLPSLLLVP